MQNDKLLSCPFCGRKMVFYKNTYTNKYGKEITEQYYMHEEYDHYKEETCILDDIMMPCVIGAGDAEPEIGCIGEYARKWNTRKPMERIEEQVRNSFKEYLDEIVDNSKKLDKVDFLLKQKKEICNIVRNGGKE